MFSNTLSISKTTIQTSFLKRTASGTIKQDKRGRHNKHSGVEKICESRVMSIQKLLRSHYVQKYETCQYLPEELNIKEMHCLYTKHCHENGFAVENYKF